VGRAARSSYGGHAGHPERRPASAGAPGQGRAAPGPGRAAAPAISGLATGDKVIHAKFGEGMVLGVEPGGVVRVFFPGLGEQKRLLLEYAPLKKA